MGDGRIKGGEEEEDDDEGEGEIEASFICLSMRPTYNRLPGSGYTVSQDFNYIFRFHISSVLFLVRFDFHTLSSLSGFLHTSAKQHPVFPAKETHLFDT